MKGNYTEYSLLDIAVRTWGPRVAEAALAFEARWTRNALKFHNPQLAEQFEAQLERYRRSLVVGTAAEVDVGGARLCRAYAQIAAELQAAGVSDDAYQIGRDPKSGLTIALGPKSCCGRVHELFGNAVQWFSPDEVATIIAMDERFRALANVKRVFPGAEINQVNEWASVAGG